MKHKPYPSDLTDDQWAILEPRVPEAKPGGRSRKYPMRRILDALFYHARAGGSWRALPHDFPPWKTVYNYFRAWAAAVQVQQGLAFLGSPCDSTRQGLVSKVSWLVRYHAPENQTFSSFQHPQPADNDSRSLGRGSILNDRSDRRLFAPVRGYCNGYSARKAG